MKTISLYFIFLLSFCLMSCKEKNKLNLIPGCYANKGLLDESHFGNLIWELPRLSEQLFVQNGDSVMVDNLWEQLPTKFTQLSETQIKLNTQMYGKDVVLTVQSPTSIMFEGEDKSSVKYKHEYVLSKSGFVELLNQKLISGRYTLHNANMVDTILFNADGSIQNWKYSEYVVCVSGDCADMPITPANIIMFKQQDEITFMVIRSAFRDSTQMLILHALSEPVEDVKGELSVLKDSVVLVKIN